MKLFIATIMAVVVALCCVGFAMNGISLSATLAAMGIAPGELVLIGSFLLSIGFVRRHLHRLQPVA